MQDPNVMDEGERLMVEAAWTRLLRDQDVEREVLKQKHEQERNEFYKQTKAHWDTSYEWHRKRAQEAGKLVGPRREW